MTGNRRQYNGCMTAMWGYSRRVSPRKASGREIKFTMLYDEEERDMLEELARADDRSAAAWVRLTIRREYAAKFGEQKPKSKRR